MALLLAAACGGPVPGSPIERVTIPPGATFGQARDSLVARGIIAHPRWFTLVARVRGLDRHIKAGVYEFHRGERVGRVLTALDQGRGALVRFTVPEGLTIEETAALAAEELGLSADSIRAAARDTALARDLGLPAASLEGYLLPETYLLPANITPWGLVRTMVREFEAAWPSAWDARLDSLGLRRDQVLTLASIVEGEAQVDSERPIIAGVYLNRLRVGMPLQADPTVQYAIQLATGRRKPRLFEKDYQFASPYNTYLRQGLPPGPISSPGLASIRAVLYPAEVPYLFFVAASDGRHRFSRTYGEHLRAIAAIRQPRGESDTGTPTRPTPSAPTP